MSLDHLLAGDAGSRLAVTRGEHGDPHLYLGPHPAKLGGGIEGTVIRVFRPGAASVVLLDPVGSSDKKAKGKKAPGKKAGGETMTEIAPGLFAAWCEGRDPEAPYRLEVTGEDGTARELEDPYRFSVTVSDEDLYFFAEGTHLQLWTCLGARSVRHEGVDGWAFSVWAPNARRVSVVGRWNGWNGRVHAMRRLGISGMWELFLPEVGPGELYKFEILTGKGQKVLRADPLARWSEKAPQTASRLFESTYAWEDDAWMRAHESRDVRHEPISIYEVHLGSWRKGEDGADLSYREMAPALVEHVKSLGFNYLELLPVAEHPFDGSWGYQITGYFAPTARYGDPDDFRYFVDYCHRHDIGVIVDWVPAHFVKDAHGLGRFDGTALYEHQDPRRGEHPDWGTYIFNYGRYEVRNFLVANALYWLQELHVDGLRVDAVASMLYLDYSRKEGEWLPNERGGRENDDAIALLQEVNRQMEIHFPGRFTVAEESTAWPHITKPVSEGGLGFTFKWNMGWMHDTLNYFAVDPLFRSHQQDRLTFAMMYEYSEAFVNPLSHDEVVHGKGSLFRRMAGDTWRKFANLRALLAYQFTRPGKILLFMGSELASPREWSHEKSLEWELLEKPEHAALRDFLAALGRLYLESPSLWRLDPDPAGFDWVACHDKERSVISFVRWADPAVRESAGGPNTAPAEKTATKKTATKKTNAGKTVAKKSKAEKTGKDARIPAEDREHLLVVMNLTPVPREDYLLGAPAAGRYRVVLSSDDTRFGGSGYAREEAWTTVDEPMDDRPQSLRLTLPPLSVMVLAHEAVTALSSNL